MKMHGLGILLLALGMPAGVAAQSIHPFFKAEDLVWWPELSGKWSLDSEATLEIQELSDKSYGLTLRVDKDSAFYFRAHLFRSGERYFLDGQVVGLKLPEREAAPVPEAVSSDFKPDQTDFLLNRQHGLLLVSLSADSTELSMALWEDEWLPQMADAGKISLAHTKDDLGRLLLTAESDDLRDWLRDVPDQAFGKKEVLTRQEAEDQPAARESVETGHERSARCSGNGNFASDLQAETVSK